MRINFMIQILTIQKNLSFIKKIIKKKRLYKHCRFCMGKMRPSRDEIHENRF